jgi:hypothetical protein
MFIGKAIIILTTTATICQNERIFFSKGDICNGNFYTEILVYCLAKHVNRLISPAIYATTTAETPTGSCHHS